VPPDEPSRESFCAVHHFVLDSLRSRVYLTLHAAAQQKEIIMADTEVTAPKVEAAKVETAVKKVEKAAEKVTEKVTAQVTEAVKTTTDAVKSTTEAATSRFKEAQATVKANIEKASEAATTRFKDAQAQVKANVEKASEFARTAAGVQRSAVETVVEAGKIYGEGLQGLATHAVEVNRVQFEDTIAHLRALTSVKSVKEALELQAKFARATASRALAEGSTFVEDYLKVAHQALTPVTTKVREAAEKVKTGA
jgi:phasin family protein